MNSMDKIIAVKEKYEDKLLKLPGVISIGIAGSEKEKYIKVLVLAITSDIRNKIPNNLEGFKVVVQESSEIKAYN